jgi:hypothetical protein
MDTPLILKAELGDFLYIIIFVVLMFAGVLEKMLKAKKQQTPPPQPQDDFEDVDEQPAESQPQTLEDIMRRMMQTHETPPREEASYPEEAQSLEVIPDTPYYHYQPIFTEPSEIEAYSPDLIEEEKATTELSEYQFDIRQAVIASEILNRKY